MAGFFSTADPARNAEMGSGSTPRNGAGSITTDTAATYTERFLNAFGIQYYLVEDGSDAERISVAFEEAKKTK